MNGPDFANDPVYQAMLEEERKVMPALSLADRGRLALRRGRYTMAQKRAWRKEHPEIAAVKLQAAKALDGADLEELIGKAAQWMRGRGFELLTRVAEGEPCACCAKCKAQRPDLKAIALLAETVNKAVSLELARIQSKRASREKSDVQLDWAPEGAKG